MKPSRTAQVILFSLLAAACGSSTDVTIAPPAGPSTTDGTGAAADDTTDPDGTASGTEQPKTFALAQGLAITEIAMNQGVKVSIIKDGAAVAKTNAPIVAGRKGLLRVYVTPATSWDGREITCELRIASGSRPLVLLTDKKSPRAKSTDDVLTSTFNFEITGENLRVDASFTVALIDAKAEKAKPTGDNAALFPKDGAPQPMGLVPTGKLKVVIVPVQYDADSSHRLPDISTTQVTTYRNMMLKRYPASDVEVTVHEPYPWSTAIGANGSGFSSILNAMVKLRQTDNVGADTYYYGAFTPTSSFGSFCQGGCVTGLSGVGDDPRDSFLRASVGVGFTGSDTASTMSHELGHAHGRNHAPCGGANGVDPSFPHSGGGIGVWGYDIVDKTLISPLKGKDFMGYCQPGWVSDYTYSALHERIAILAGAKSSSGPAVAASYRMVAVGADGEIASVQSITLDEEPQGESRPLTYLAGNGAAIGAGVAKFYRYDHLEGGFYVVPEGGVTVSAVRIPGLAKLIQIH